MADRPLDAAIVAALDEGRGAQAKWEERAAPCGLLLGVDESIGYEGIPDEFRAFASWGVDGVHEGLRIDSPAQVQEPTVVMVSPTDFGEPIIVKAAHVRAWLDLVAVEERLGFGADQGVHRLAALAARVDAGLLAIPETEEAVEAWLVDRPSSAGEADAER